MIRIPADAFAQYLAMPAPERSYDALARRLRVGKRSITRLAARERWRERLAKIESQAREDLDRKAGETLQAINARHLKMVRAIQAKALAALQAMPLDSGMDAVRALDISIKQERLIFGEPSERTEVDVEQVCRDEYRRWMTPPVSHHAPRGDGGEDSARSLRS